MQPAKGHGKHKVGTADAQGRGKPGSPSLTFYPAYTFKPASLTWNQWVKLTCRDIHSVLKPQDNYANTVEILGRSSLLLFYLNHPVQYVQVVGVVVAREEYFDKFWLFTVDDSTGATLDVTCPKPEKDKVSTGAQGAQEDDPALNADLQQNLSCLQIGTVVQAKGTLTTFRQTRQLSLLRLFIVHSTAKELALISDRTRFYTSTLCKPWHLSARKLDHLRRQRDADEKDKDESAERKRRRKQQRREREERHAKMLEQEYERDEELRRGGADEAKWWGEMLKQKPQDDTDQGEVSQP
jgi:hypothetical protein